MSAAPVTTPPDWERIEAQFSAGVMSNREIAVAHTEAGTPVTEGAIRKRANKLGWTRDLSARVKAKADEIVRQQTVRAERKAGDTPTEKQTVEVEAEVQARIRMSHRTDIQRSKRIVNNLMEHLERHSPVLEPVKDGDLTPDAKLLSVASLKDQAGVLDKLVTTQKTLVSLEREAFGIAQMVENPDDLPAIDQMEGARRLAFILHRAAALTKTGGA